MSFQNPLNLLWFLPLGAAIVSLYLLRMRRLDVQVPATFLWPNQTEELRANSLFQRLRFNWLMVLQLLAAAAMCLAFAKPQMRQAGLLGQTTVIVLDTSASMRATDVSPSRFDQGLALVKEAISTGGANDRVALIEAAAVPKVAFSLGNDPSKQREALNRVRPSDTEGNMDEAMRLAAALVSSLESARILVISDGCFRKIENFSAGKASVVYKSIGSRQENVGLTAIGGAKTNRGNELYVGLKNYGLNQAAVTVDVFADRKLVHTTKQTLASQKPGGFTCLAPSDTKLVEAKITTKDLLDADNYAVSSLDPNSALSVLLISKGNPFLERALLLDSRVQLDRAETVPVGLKNGSAMKYDLVIFDGVDASPVGSRAILSFGRNNEAVGVNATGKIATPEVLDAVDHPLLRGVDFRSVYIESGQRLEPAKTSRALVETNQGPLLTLEDGAQKKIACAFEVMNSDFPLQVGFPIFITNVLDFLASESVTGDRVVSTGAPFRVRTPDTVTLKIPGRGSVSVPSNGSVAVVREVDTVGDYELTVGGKTSRVYAALRSAVESDIAPRPDLVLGSGKVKAVQTPFRLQEYWRLVVLICLGLLAFEWCFFARKS
jgi:Ca-activated chloride channel homolog